MRFSILPMIIARDFETNMLNVWYNEIALQLLTQQPLVFGRGYVIFI